VTRQGLGTTAKRRRPASSVASVLRSSTLASCVLGWLAFRASEAPSRHRPDRYPLVALIILDGWGCAPPGPGNAVELADTPVFDDLWTRFPHTTLQASGESVGLPPGQMGNSEVGHLTIGAGRIVYQDLVRIDRAIEDGSFYSNPALTAAFERARSRDGNVHFLGLASYGGVHSHLDHLRALLELARRHELDGRTYVHAFTDGRDVSPTSAADDLAALVAEGAWVSTVCGRYYAMDRDGRWERTDKAVAAICEGVGAEATDAVEAVRASYERGVTDEFIEPIVLPQPRLDVNDTAIFFNFRPDRARQLTQRLLERGFDLTTMTRYRDDFDCPVAFEEQDVHGTMAEVLAEHGVRQLHMAETEKYAHVTYFFNGGREEEWAGEARILVPSPRDVATYDQKPEMSADEVAARFEEEIPKDYGFAIVNFANPDMVGHSGVIPAVVQAVEAVDACLGRVVGTVERLGGVCLVTADHGNAEQMLEPDGVSPHTAHTLNPVPLIVTIPGIRLAEDGTLADLVPTCLALLGVPQERGMTGRDLVISV
jgi:2,3-bisphosphoglycerate-independent phosphoglycerate mutase